MTEDVEISREMIDDIFESEEDKILDKSELIGGGLSWKLSSSGMLMLIETH